MNLLHKLLDISTNDTVAIIGSGGKTTLLWKLAQERKNTGAFVTTSTHIMKPTESECDIFLSPENNDFIPITYGKVTSALYANKENKCIGISEELFVNLTNSNVPILYEADGSKRMPAKLHNESEPVIYPNTDIVVLVIGLSALGKPVKDVCHRYNLNKNFNPDDIFSVKHLIYCIEDGIKSANMPLNKIRILFNQLDLIENKDVIHSLCESLEYPFVSCSILKNYI